MVTRGGTSRPIEKTGPISGAMVLQMLKMGRDEVPVGDVNAYKYL